MDWALASGYSILGLKMDTYVATTGVFDSIGQWGGLGLSYLFIFAVIGVAQLLLHRNIVGPAVTRKIVHIGVAHWWLIAMLTIADLAVALIGPVSFIVINWISYRRHVFAAMEHEEPRKNLGTVYFPIALTALVLLTWSGLFPRWYGLVAILVLGWGDGSASLIGERFGSRGTARRFSVPGGRKSVIGTLAMFSASALVAAVVLFAVAGLAGASGAVEAADAIEKAGVSGPGRTTVSDAPLPAGPAALSSWFTATATKITADSWVAQPTDSAGTHRALPPGWSCAAGSRADRPPWRCRRPRRGTRNRRGCKPGVRVV